jgi:hypothetical protein
MQTDHEEIVPAGRRGWLSAPVLGGLAVVLILVVVAVLVAGRFSAPPPAASTPAAAPAPSAPSSGQARRQEDIAVCDAALAAAQGLGVVPGFATRTSDATRPGGAQGRYVCSAKTDASQFDIMFDIACTKLGNPACIIPVTVSQNGAVVYHRK